MSILQLLTELDRQGVEEPNDFDRDSLLRHVNSMKSELEMALNVVLELDSSAQDATFVCNLGCFDQQMRPDYLICMTFSNFGRLCLVWGDRDWIREHNEPIRLCETVLTHNAYVPLRPPDVDQEYTGCHDEWTGRTWLDRFFAHF